MGKRANKVLPVKMVRQEKQAIKVRKVPSALQVLLVLQAQKVLKASRGKLECLVTKEMTAFKGLLVHQD